MEKQTLFDIALNCTDLFIKWPISTVGIIKNIGISEVFSLYFLFIPI